MAVNAESEEKDSTDFPHVGSVKLSLDFKITDDGQDEIRKSGYYFTPDGVCLTLNTNQRPKRFQSNAEFERFGALIEKYIFFLLKHQFKLNDIRMTCLSPPKSERQQKQKRKKKLKTSIMAKLYSPEIAESHFEPQTIFASANYTSNNTLCILIPGTGSVRVAQWSRALCINDGLSVGSMCPFISAAMHRKWSIMLLDPNGRLHDSNKREYSDLHLLSVYEQYIKPYLNTKSANHESDEKQNDSPRKIDNIFIVCHSAAGIATTRLLNERKSILPFIRGVAGTDVDFGRAKNEQTKQVFKRYVVNYRASYQELGTVLSAEDEYPLRVSAGHPQHEYTSASAFDLIFKHFDENLC